MAGPKGRKREQFWKEASSVRQIRGEKPTERQHKTEIGRKMGLQNEGDGGKNVGKILRGREWEALWEVSCILGQRCTQKERSLLSSHGALRSCTLLLAPITCRGTLAKTMPGELRGEAQGR